MAHNNSAKKRIRQIVKRTAINRARRSRLRNSVKKVEAAIAAGGKAEAQAALKAAQPELMGGINKGVIHKKTVARKLSRLSARIKAMG